MFKTKEILKSARENVKRNFWVYLAVVFLYSILLGFSEGVLSKFFNMNDMIMNIRNGNFSKEVFLNLNSDMYLNMTTDSMLMFSNLLGFPLMLFLINPLIIGINKLFIKGAGDKADFNTIFYPFKNSYKKVFSITFIKYIIISAITLFLTFAYLILTVVFVISLNTMVSIFLSPTVAGVVYYIGVIIFSLITTIIYLVVFLNITYNFSMIDYIIAENPETDFVNAYIKSKEMVKGKKFAIFKVDVWYGIINLLTIFIPFLMIAIGLAKLWFSMGGMLYFVLGLYFIIPAMLVRVFVNVYKNSAWANIYLKIKPADEVTEE